MKVTSARNEPLAGLRARGRSTTGLAAGASASVDSVGFLGVPEAELTPAVRAALLTLSQEVGDLRDEVALLKARLGEAQDLAARDSLTPLLNRRGFLRELARVRAFAERYGHPASLVYFDLDGFKAINDRLGHAAGDAALKAVADRLSAQIRETDVLGRVGGDEFALVLAQADRSAAEAKAEALAQAIEATPLAFGEWFAPIRLSFGVCEVTADLEPEALIARADAAMFAAKRLRKAG
jgi:diguanylate cyclase (GGDEF)-like protein